MLLEVNEPRTAIILAPPLDDQTIANLNELALLPDQRVVIAVRNEHKRWAASVPRSTVFDWIDDSFAEVQRNVRHALDVTNSQPNTSVVVLFGPNDLRDAVLTRCGTVQVGGFLMHDCLPDIMVDSVANLRFAIRTRQRGFLGEHLTTIGKVVYSDKGQVWTQQGMLTNPRLDQPTSGRLPVAFLGRYFAREDQRSRKHQFSQRLIAFKNGRDPGAITSSALGQGLSLMAEGSNFTKIIPVPPKQNKPNRIGNQIFESLSGDTGLRPLVKLECLTVAVDYPSQKGLGFDDRARNVAGRFAANEVVGDNILLVEDVITSGATVVECARTLYQAGARNVIVLAMGLNQNIVLADDDETLPCPKCERGSMRIRFRNDGGRGFWGCGNFPECTAAIDWASGLSEFNRQTRRESIATLHDIDF